MVSTAAFHARVRGSVPGLGGLKETKLLLPHPRVKVSIVGSLRDREVAYSASDRQGSNFETCVWRTVSSQSSHHPQEVLLAQFSLYVHKGVLKPDSFHLTYINVKKVDVGVQILNMPNSTNMDSPTNATGKYVTLHVYLKMLLISILGSLRVTFINLGAATCMFFRHVTILWGTVKIIRPIYWNDL